MSRSAQLAWVDREVDRAELPLKANWRRLVVGDRLRTGDTLRTGEDALARVEFPWMQVTLGPSSMLTIPASAVLSTVLEQGRAEFSGAGRDIVKIRVGDGEVRGGGRLVLRRSAGRTTATALAGAFRIRAAGRTVEIKAGEGTTVTDGRPPEPASALPAAPSALLPGQDVAYVRAGQPVELRWTAKGAAASHVEVLALDRDDVLLARDSRRAAGAARDSLARHLPLARVLARREGRRERAVADRPRLSRRALSALPYRQA